MPAATPTLNVQDLLAGAILKVEYAAWVANYGASTFADIGAIKDAKFHTEVQDSIIDADNALADIGAFNVKVLGGFDVKVLQQNLRTRAISLGKKTTDVVVVAKAGAAGTATLGMGALSTVDYYCLRLTCAVNLKPGYTEAATDTYTSAVILVPRAKPKVKEEREFSKSKVVIQGQAWTFFHDSTCPAGSELWKEAHSTEYP